MSEDSVAAGVAGMVERLRAEPQRAAVTFRAQTVLEEGLRCDTATRRHTLVVDEPASIGGTGEGASPVEVVLAGLAACQAITYRVWSARLGIPFERVRVCVEGDADLRGFFGLGEERVRAGFGAIRLDVAIEGPEPRARYEELAEAVDRACPVLDMLTVPAEVTRTLSVPQSAPAT